MLIKIVFTIVVIIGVILFFRVKQSRVVAVAKAETAAAADEQGASSSISPRVLAYGLLGALAGIALLIFVFDHQRDNRIVDIRVISNGETAHYQARHKSIKGRSFVTLDGARVTLGESDRIEMVEP